MPEDWVPTVNDLRVKLCYICREEERYDKPEEPPRQWTHPCSCTLVAHESCLLQWITSAQQSPDRAPNALKCPQCGDKYELISDNPLTLRFLDRLNRTLSRAGKFVTISTIGIVVATFSTGVYLICTSYGAFALREFLGPEMYDTLVSDDPSNWSWLSYMNLPLIPITLIMSRTPLLTNYSPLIPLLFVWPAATPVATSDIAMRAHWTGLKTGVTSFLPTGPTPLWPPSPTLVSALFPSMRALYTVGIARLTHWVMNTRETPAAPVRRYEWAMGENAAAFRIHVGAQVNPVPQPEAQNQQQQQQPQQPQPQPAQAQAGQEDAAPGADAGAAAERTIRITGASIGRLIGGALIMPTVSRLMGALLLRLSGTIPLLRLILAPKPHLDRRLPRVWNMKPQVRETRTTMQLIGVGLRLVLCGSNVWQESDPVWCVPSIFDTQSVITRASAGGGIQLDLVSSLWCALWLAKQELESRTVKNKSFAGVDVRELDLIPRA